MTSRILRIVNEKGLHARASARFVEVVEAHDARAIVAKDGMEVAGDSIMGLLMRHVISMTSCTHSLVSCAGVVTSAGCACSSPVNRLR